METSWNLTPLYTGFDAPELKQDIEKLDASLNELIEYTNSSFSSTENASDKLLHYYESVNDVLDLMYKILTFGSLNYAVNTKNTEALKLVERIDGYQPKLTQITVALRRWLSGIDDINQVISQNEALKTYEYSINYEKQLSKYLLSDAEETLLSEMKNTGSNAWSKLQDATVSSLLVRYDDELLPLSIIRNYAYSSDAEKRKKAYEAELEAYKKMDQVSASCLNAIKGEVLTVVNKRKYESPLQMTLLHSRMDKETLDVLMKTIESYLPVFREYLKKKASILGHKGSLPFYDLFAPIGETSKEYSYEEAAQLIIDKFSTFSKELGDFAKKAFENSWIDSVPKEGKIGGAFCSTIHGIKECRIMTNFSNSFSDVITIAHELGHAYHSECLKDEPFTNNDYPMPLAETASTFCETLVFNSVLKELPKEEALVVLEGSIMEATQVIVDIYSRFLFESELFARRVNGSLSVDELKEIMLDAQKKAYGDGLDHEYLHPYMWMCKPHYYSADLNFYNFPYAFGALLSKGLYAKYLEMGDEFVPKYKEFLVATGCNSIKDTLKTLDIDAHSEEFWKKSLDLISEEINTFINS